MSKLQALFLLFMLVLTSVSAQTDYYPAGDYPEGDYVGGEFFQAPEYESQRELVAQIILPFVILYVLMQFLLYNVMRFTLDPEEELSDSEIGRYSTLLAIAIPAMLITTPMWDKIRLALEGVGAAVIATFVIVMAYIIYKMST